MTLQSEERLGQSSRKFYIQRSAVVRNIISVPMGFFEMISGVSWIKLY